MAAFDYLSFISNQAVLVGNGGPWSCTGFDGPCSQSLIDDYGLIKSTSSIQDMNGDVHTSLVASITLANSEFKGATRMPFTISFSVQATARGGSPDPIHLRSMVGGIGSDYPHLQYDTSDPVYATYSDAWNSRPSQISLEIDALCANLSTAIVTVAFSNLNFVIHDVLYGAASATGSTSFSSPSALSASFSSSTSKYGSISTSSINNRTSTSHSALFTTTISGKQTVIGSMIPSSSDYGLFQSYLSSSTNFPESSSMNASERAGVIAGSLVALGLILIAISFWYRWRRRRMARSGKIEIRDGQSQRNVDSRMTQRPWIPRPYRKRLYSSTTEPRNGTPVEDQRAEPWAPRPYRQRPYSGPTTENAVVLPIENDNVVPAGLGVQEAVVLSRSRSEDTSSYRLNLLPPAYSQITSRPTSRPSMAIESA